MRHQDCYDGRFNDVFFDAMGCKNVTFTRTGILSKMKVL
jgi:hypothetical protein